jgi:hypothetical protein
MKFNWNFLKMLNWKWLCIGGLVGSVLFFIIDCMKNNYQAAMIQVICGLGYAAGLTYLSLKEHKEIKENR